MPAARLLAPVCEKRWVLGGGVFEERERESEVVESCREREMEVQEVAEGVQGSIQPAGLGDAFRPQNEKPVLHHGSPWCVLLILPLTRRILPCGFAHTETCTHLYSYNTHAPWFFVPNNKEIICSFRQ